MAALGAGQHPGADIWCAHKCGDVQVCYREHCVAVGQLGRGTGKAGKRKYDCVACGGKYQMAFNPGKKHWMVWNTFCGCNPRVIRDQLLGRGIDPECLGGFYSDSHVNYIADTTTTTDRSNAELLVIARKYEALQKLIADSGSYLVRMAAHRIDEGDGGLPARLDVLLPGGADQGAEFLDLARRAGIGHSRYQLAERWFAKQEAEVRASGYPTSP